MKTNRYLGNLTGQKWWLELKITLPNGKKISQKNLFNSQAGANEAVASARKDESRGAYRIDSVVVKRQ